jgi:hypothetical protein
MPIEAVLVAMAVVTMFVIFAVALVWADRQTSRGRLDPDTKH